MPEMLIGGEWCAARNGEELDVLDPATEETVATVPSGSPEDVDAAVAAALAAFPAWSRTDPEARAEILRKSLELLDANRERLVDTLVHEQGKPTFEAAGELDHLIHGLRYYADLSTKLRGSYQPLPSALGESYGLVIRRPVGVVAAIVPFNYPLTLMGTKIGPALVAGNTVVVKPATTTPLSALIVAELMHEAGLPAGVLNVVTGTGANIGDALSGHPDVRRVAFTGETETGRRIMGIAGPQFKRVTMELGGSDPVIICADADVKRAVKGVLIGRFWNAGQSCLAGKRVYVFEEVYDACVEQLAGRARALRAGRRLGQGREAEDPHGARAHRRPARDAARAGRGLAQARRRRALRRYRAGGFREGLLHAADARGRRAGRLARRGRGDVRARCSRSSR